MIIIIPIPIIIINDTMINNENNSVHAQRYTDNNRKRSPKFFKWQARKVKLKSARKDGVIIPLLRFPYTIALKIAGLVYST